MFLGSFTGKKNNQYQILEAYFTITYNNSSVYQPDIQDTAHRRAQEGQLKSQQFHVESQSFCHVHHTTDF